MLFNKGEWCKNHPIGTLGVIIRTSKKTPNKILAGGHSKGSHGLEVISKLKCYLNVVPPGHLVCRNGQEEINQVLNGVGSCSDS